MNNTSAIIGCPQIVETKGGVRLMAEIRLKEFTKQMWYEVPGDKAGWFLAERGDAFLVGLILQLMQHNVAEIVVEAPLSSQLWHNLTFFFMPMMAAAFRDLDVVRIRSEGLVSDGCCGSGVATGFSGGVDSFSALKHHFSEELHDNYRVTDLLFHNVGAHGDSDQDAARHLFEQRYQLLKRFPEGVGLPFVKVDSNIADILSFEFTQVYMTVNASVVLALQKRFAKYFYASSYKYADCGVTKTDLIGRFDPFAFHLLSSESLQCISTGSQMSRVQKTAHISEYSPSYEFLNVCVDAKAGGRNCSRCKKCCRTILTLELLERLEPYSNVFDLAAFRMVRQQYIENYVVRAMPGEFEYEILELAMSSCHESWVRAARTRYKRRKKFEKLVAYGFKVGSRCGVV